jgi:hypothetical protein
VEAFDNLRCLCYRNTCAHSQSLTLIHMQSAALESLERYGMGTHAFLDAADVAQAVLLDCAVEDRGVHLVQSQRCAQLRTGPRTFLPLTLRWLAHRLLRSDLFAPLQRFTRRMPQL